MNLLVDPNDFPASRKSVYLNTASVALMYKGAQQAIIEWQTDLAENGTIHFDEIAEATVFEKLHHAAAQLLNAQPEDIAVGSSATELLSSLAWAIMPEAKSNVVSTDVVFPTTIYPWTRVANHRHFEIRLVKGVDGHTHLEDIAQCIDENTAVVCISHVEYGSGQQYDLSKLTNAAHAHGALMVVDATQSAGAVPIDVQASGIDALIASGYKWLCGPFGVALMYLAPQLQELLEPGVVGFRSHEDMWDLKAHRLTYPRTARRFEFSTMAYGCALGLAESIEYLNGIGIERIFSYNAALAEQLIEGLNQRNAKIVSSTDGAERTSIVSVRFPGKDSPSLAKHLNAAKVVVSSRGDLVRFSPHLYNVSEDIERALSSVDRFAEGCG